MRYTIALCMASLAATSAAAEVPRVVTDIPAVHALVVQVMGDLGTPDLLLERGADEHSFQMRPSQAAALNDAGVVFWVGHELTPWLERALESVPDTVVRVGLLDAPETMVRDYDGEDEDHDGGAEEGHGHGSVDPHAWLSPANATAWVGVIAAELARLDPENAATYGANAAVAVTGIAQTDAAVRAILAPVADQPFIVFHDAFGYFADYYGLNIAGAIAEGDAAAPGAARVAALRDMVLKGKAVCVFPEAQHDPALLEQITDGSTARIGGVLDPVGASYEAGGQMYAALLSDMATTLAACLRAP
jgi:zinc transport system substrate-binding protein